MAFASPARKACLLHAVSDCHAANRRGSRARLLADTEGSSTASGTKNGSEAKEQGNPGCATNLLEGSRARAAYGYAIQKDGGAACHNAVQQPPRPPHAERSPRQCGPSHRQASDGCSIEQPQPRNIQQTHSRHPPFQNPSNPSEGKSPHKRSQKNPLSQWNADAGYYQPMTDLSSHVDITPSEDTSDRESCSVPNCVVWSSSEPIIVAIWTY